jgi:hypothetical protein
MALRLHAIAPDEAAEIKSGLPGGARIIVFRELGAVVSDREKFALDEPDPLLAEEHRAIVDAVFRHNVVLPTPTGVVFRTEQVLTRWMELHYVALSDALAFVNDRAVARVHIRRAGGHADESDAGADIAEAAAEIFRALRRKAVASVPLSVEEITGIALSSAFLVERELWKDFERAVGEARDANHKLSIDQTGPWAPYDFVRMQFGERQQ